MKRVISWVLAIVFVTPIYTLTAGEVTLVAERTDARGVELLKTLAEEFRKLTTYEVAFRVVADEMEVSGRYGVEGEKYALQVGDAEVYSDGVVRYEVDKGHREVVINNVEKLSHNLLDNPVHAFEFVTDEYEVSVVESRQDWAVIRLEPKAESKQSVGSIEVAMNLKSHLPQRVEYNYDGERIVVKIESVGSLSGGVAQFDKRNYKGYEMIDFR